MMFEQKLKVQIKQQQRIDYQSLLILGLWIRFLKYVQSQKSL
ncbi:unnamed protein product [Paramecium primaurelia]|uniref:Uncharacterized protein n=1 Tax=Paramecium primaurelia TaxID=5886 RepID=A0A8S1NSB9_PARPR|nr:unnamed protein product [Paramecium primaurelia]